MLSEKHGATWVYLVLLTAAGHSVSASCAITLCVLQLHSIQYCCLVTACWAGGRIKCCRCVWGNLWRAFEEGVSHSSWSSSRTESWTSHLFKGFLATQYLTLSDTDHGDSQRALKYKWLISCQVCPHLSLCFFSSFLGPFFSLIYLFSNLSCHSSALSVFGPFTTMLQYGFISTGYTQWQCFWNHTG